MLFKCKQWTIKLELNGQTETDEVEGYTIYNMDEEGTKKFYQIKEGRYGQPLVEPEPSLRTPAPPNLKYQRGSEPVDPKELNISGVIIQEQSHDRFQAKTVARFSLTNGPKSGTTVSEDFTTVEVEGRTFHLHTLIDKDKNRFIGSMDAVYGPSKPETVQVVELADICFV